MPQREVLPRGVDATDFMSSRKVLPPGFITTDSVHCRILLPSRGEFSYELFLWHVLPCRFCLPNILPYAHRLLLRHEYWQLPGVLSWVLLHRGRVSADVPLRSVLSFRKLLAAGLPQQSGNSVLPLRVVRRLAELPRWLLLHVNV